MRRPFPRSSKPCVNAGRTSGSRPGWYERGGREFPALLTVYPLFDDQGPIVSVLGVTLDITRQKEAEHAVRVSERRYRRLVEMSPDAVVIHSQGRTVLTNRAAADLVGATDPKDLLGRSLMDFVHPEYVEAVKDHIERTVSGQRVPFMEQKILRLDGTEAEVEVAGVPFVFKGREAAHLVARDISARKQTERELRRRIEFERLVTDISTQFIRLAPEEIDAHIDRALATIGRFVGADRSYVFRFSPDGRRMTNTHEWCAEGIRPAVHRIRDVSVEAFPWIVGRLRNREVVQVSHAEQLPPVAAAERREFAAQGIRSLVNVPILLGEAVFGFLGFDAVRAPKSWPDETVALLRIVGEIFANALARKRAEEDLRRAMAELEEFKSIIDRSPVYVFVWRVADGWPVEFASENVRQLGYTPEDFTSGGVSWPGITHPEDVPRLQAEIAANLQAGRLEFSQEYRLFTADGEVRWIDDRNRAVTDAEGTVTHIQGILFDVTERKRAEEALRESEQRFRALIDNLPVGIYRNTPGPQGRFLMANQAMARLYGYDSVEEFLRIDASDLHKNQAERKAFSDKLIARGKVVGEEMLLRRKDGSTIWGSLTAQVVRDADGKFA